MNYDKTKGFIGIATSYSGGDYSYAKLNKYIQRDSGITSTPNQMQDKDSYVNGNGYLKRTVLPHSRSKIEINTRYMDAYDKCTFVKHLKDAMQLGDGTCDESERKVRIRFYNDWKDDYETAFCYISDVDFQPGGLVNGIPMYQPIRIAFIEY